MAETAAAPESSSTTTARTFCAPRRLKENAVTIPNAVMMIEHYNRLGRLLQNHVPVTLEVNIDAKFTGDHEHGFDTVAEIPGTDPKLKDQVVMVGGHLDSWISGTGATDNGAGSIMAMEAMRILKALASSPSERSASHSGRAKSRASAVRAGMSTTTLAALRVRRCPSAVR